MSLEASDIAEMEETKVGFMGSLGLASTIVALTVSRPL
jgi:hypothetical protein